MTKPSQPTKSLGLTACAAACAVASLALPAGAVEPRAAAVAVAVGNPVAGNNGFGVVTEKNALLGSTESEGPVAVGGDLAYGAGYDVSLHTAGTFTVPGDARPTALLVGGRIDYADSSPAGVLKVLADGYVKIGDATGSEVVTKDRNGATVKTRVTATGAGHDATPRIELTNEQPASSVAPAPGLMDFTSLFATYRNRADALATCANTVEIVDPGRITLDTARTNVLHLTGAELNGLSELTFLNRPTAAGPLVIDVDTTATGSVFTWHVPHLAGVSGVDAPYILWNFADATAITIATGDSIEGTIYAPRAHLTDLDPADIEGDVIVRSLTAGPLDANTRAKSPRRGVQRELRAAPVNAGEIHSSPFAADLSCGAEPTPTPSPTEPTPTPTPTEPTPTPTPTEPEPEPSTTSPSAPSTPSASPGYPGPDGDLADSGTSARTYAAAALAVLSTVGGLLLVRRFRR
ncbi:collagen-binding domain-containing protein [Streptomyces sp. NPDC058659]|uniref:collagen-binding domain-containing protein n=1 Tax=unclassified Streptomyces TaxID=2593676 RepID=UPI0036640612